MVISGVLTVVLLVLARVFVKSEHSKNLILKFSAIITVAIHYSNLWVDYFTTGGNATVSSNQILPVYPCNVIMWMLLFISLLPNKQCRLFHMLGEFCFLIGSVCGTLGVVLNFNLIPIPSNLRAQNKVMHVLERLLPWVTLALVIITLIVSILR
jgi:hypothetical protein